MKGWAVLEVSPTTLRMDLSLHPHNILPTQGSASYGPQAKSSLQPVFVNKLFIGTKLHPFMCSVLSMAAIWLVKTETVLAPKPEIFTV